MMVGITKLSLHLHQFLQLIQEELGDLGEFVQLLHRVTLFKGTAEGKNAMWGWTNNMTHVIPLRPIVY